MKSLHTYQEEVKARFNKEFTNSHPGDSGIGGNAPQEPVYEWACGPEDMVALLKDATTQAYLLGLRKAQELVPEAYDDKFIEGRAEESSGWAMRQWNACRTEIETTLTQEIDKLTHTV